MELTGCSRIFFLNISNSNQGILYIKSHQEALQIVIFTFCHNLNATIVEVLNVALQLEVPGNRRTLALKPVFWTFPDT
jgi:hypothetical protein